MRGCCASTNSLDCGWATGCVDAKAFKSSCDKVCKGNPFLLKCTNSGESFCVSYTYPDVNVKDFACKSVVESAIRSVSLTYKGQKLPTSLSSSLRTISLDVEASRSIFQNDNADITEASATTRTAKPSGSAAAGARREKSNVGAIAGGAVGGVAVFAAAAGCAAFLILRSRRKRKGTPASGMDPSEGTAIPQEMDGHENEKAMIYEADSATTRTNPGVFEADSTPIVAANEPMEAGNGGPVNSHFAPTQFLHPAAPTYQPSHAMSATSGPVASGYSEPAATGHAQHSGENPVGRVGSSSTATLTPNSPVSRAVPPSSFVSPVSPPPPASPLPP
ncbi:MAG: hypothetical protein M1825_005370 [Sarcosagium campestre]|nr:MAG: hypothetical protein M1825_005370 [Sarcosagium campestre]